ncbi:MAG TPA: prepilin-type N-terminal cleavage/methylation domain-containing protein [Candidatus Saccharimonadales bacterium]|nr:prepilin-type N-terminal cleavage/methylation domain-containing protein [Candidatus Saccharimonadales bacterium]
MKRAPQSWHQRLSQVQGNQEKRAKRICNTLSEYRTQLTPQLAKSSTRVTSSASQQGRTALAPGGFTIIELMIATSVFSLVLLVALAGFTSIGRIFYKGVTINQTQNITSQVMNDVTSNIENAASVSTLQKGASYNYYYYCIGGVRYTFNVSPKELDTSQPEDYSPGGNFGLVKDILPGATACAEPCPTSTGCASGTLPFNKPAEMLGNHMRLMKLDIASANGELYNVNITIAFGADSAFSDLNDPDKIACTGGQQDQAFCSVTRLSTGVYEGLHS